MKDGCVYCSDEFDDYIGRHDLINEFPFIKITKPFKSEIIASAYILDNYLRLCCYAYDDSRILASRKIKYCPMCGRKLKEVVE